MLGRAYVDEELSETRLLLIVTYNLTTLIGLRICKEFLEPFGAFMAPSIFSSCSRYHNEALEESLLLFWYGAVEALFACGYVRIVLAGM